MSEWFVVEGRFDAENIDDAYARLAHYFDESLADTGTRTEVFSHGAWIRVAREPTAEEEIREAGERIAMIRESAERNLGGK